MPLHTSTEFLDLCRSQIALLTRGLGASLCVVYLAEGVAEDLEPQLIPIAIYPETEDGFHPIGGARPLPASTSENPATITVLDLPLSRFLVSETGSPMVPPPTLLPELESSDGLVDSLVPATSGASTVQPTMIPLVYDNEMVGLLMTGRNDRPWTAQEYLQLEHIAHTLAVARFLDHRAQLLNGIIQHQHLLKGQQTDLFDNLLHQFRNPLTALKTFGKLLLKRLLPDDPNRGVATSIVQESDRLQELLVQFEQAIDLDKLDYPSLSLPPVVDFNPETSTPTYTQSPLLALQPSKLPLLLPSAEGATTNTLTLTACSVSDVLAPLLASATTIADDRQLSLSIDVVPNLPLAVANTTALREVLSNLIDNALKYTPSGGAVFVQAWSSHGGEVGDANLPASLSSPSPPSPSRSPSIAIAISDTGPGIPPQDLDHLFERHYRGVQVTTGIPGTGLGLAIAKDLVLRMHGEIQVFSPALVSPMTSLRDRRDPGNQQGVTFIVWLLAA